MSKLLESLRAEAAKQLPLPPGRRPCQEVMRYQRYLQRSRLRTRYAHNQGASGREVVQALALAVDLVFQHAFEAAGALPEYAGRGRSARCAIVALGGYGRRELSPHSDIDVQFLHESGDLQKGDRPAFLALLEESWLYNVFPKVQSVVRTPAESVAAGNQDLRSKTSLIEARWVCGDERLFARLQRRVISGCVAGQENAYVEQRLADQAERRRRFGNTPFLQEPNVKNGCGGLRDYQNLVWLSFFRYRTAGTAELQQRQLISAAEQADLDRAYDFLLRIRNDLHFRSERPHDVLLKAVQPAVARAMGYLDGSPSKRVDRLMRAYYGHVRTIHDLTRNVEERLALLPQPGRLPRLGDLLRARRRRAAYEVDGFKFVDGQVLPVSGRIFRERPSRLMQAFFNAQRRRLRLHPELLQLVRDHVALVTPAFRKDPGVAQMFLELLKARGQVGGCLRQMHEARFLGAYLPAFGRLTARVQHEFFHQYTVDEHTLVCLEKLDAVWHEQTPSLRPYTEMFRHLERPELLYLALLLHDAGKGEGRDHAERGARIGATVCRQLHLDDAGARRVQFLIRQHLAMVSTSQKRNLGDPHVIETFARLVGDLENLRALALLTLADSMGTSDQLWTTFKDALLLTLYQRTREHLEGQGAVVAEAERTRLLEEVHRAAPADLPADEIQAHFDRVPPRYFLHALAADVLADLRIAHEFLKPRSWPPARPRADRPRPGRRGARLFRRPLLHLGSARTVREAGRRLHRRPPQHPRRGNLYPHRRPGDRHVLRDGRRHRRPRHAAGDGAFPRPGSRGLDRACDQPGSPADSAPDRRRRRGCPVGFGSRGGRAPAEPAPAGPALKPPGAAPVPLGDPFRTSVVFDNHSSPSHTIIEIETEDRLGLLHTIATVLAGLGVDIALARIHTSNGGASDAFYVSEAGGKPILGAARQKEIRSALLAAIRALGN
ncbi:MAG: HD domain-containing protein [Verrucomicrobia bacterium]|nr:HD domain-containing protein [Verrucomicrobiota bacterium]